MDNDTQKFKCLLKTTVRRIIFLTAVFYFSFFVVYPGIAQTTTAVGNNTVIQGTEVLANDIGLTTTDIRVVVARVIRVALSLVGMIFLTLILYGGFIWMTAGGNEDKIVSAKRIIFNGSIGLLIILSSYSIVWFVGRMLGLNGDGGDGGTNVGGISFTEENFLGSGALGSSIKDHYPGRDQKGVPRNTKIIITFRKAVLASSFIENSNGSRDGGNQEIFGDCNVRETINWETDCDRLRTGEDFISITRADNGEALNGAAALVSYESGRAYTVVIRPYAPLGDDSSNISYKVKVGKGILFDDAERRNPSIFENRQPGRDFYEWNFTADTKMDLLPPMVTNVYPSPNSTENKNSVIQINFNKPIDPTGLQGELRVENGIYVLNGNNVFIRSEDSSLPAGNFRLLNNYQTLEFSPTSVCGVNACGGNVYCLPVCDRPGADCTRDTYDVLVRAARTFSTSSFEAVPFSGVMDVNGNALDGDRDGKVDSAGRAGGIFTEQRIPDNYFWKFILDNKLDITAPYIQKTTPGPDATFVAPNSELSMIFTKRMRVDSLYNISIEEQPAKSEPLCKRPLYSFNAEVGTSKVTLEHCPFLNSQRNYYMPLVDSNVEDVNFNCFYPGKGPVGLSSDNSSLVCDGENNCCDVGLSQTDAFCCNGLTDYESKDRCLTYLRASQ